MRHIDLRTSSLAAHAQIGLANKPNGQISCLSSQLAMCASVCSILFDLVRFDSIRFCSILFSEFVCFSLKLKSNADQKARPQNSARSIVSLCQCRACINWNWIEKTHTHTHTQIDRLPKMTTETTNRKCE